MPWENSQHLSKRPVRERENQALEVECEPLEREDKALEVGGELPEDGRNARTLGAFRIGVVAQTTADRRRGCVPAGRGLLTDDSPVVPGGLSGASGPRCLFRRPRAQPGQDQPMQDGLQAAQHT